MKPSTNLIKSKILVLYTRIIILTQNNKNMDPNDDFNYNAEVQPYYDEQYPYYDDSYMVGQKQASPFEVLPQSSVHDQINSLVEQIHQTVALPFGWSLLLLREFNWQTDALGDYFLNPKKYRNTIGYSEKLLSPNQADKLQTVGECGVCCNEQVLVYNICKQGFCRSCWVGQIEQKISSKNPFMKCMNNQCRAPLLDETIKSILLGEKNQKYAKICAKYDKLVCQCFTDVSKSYQVCPGADCTFCIKCENYTVTTVRCICGTCFCFKCHSDDHAPCTCDQKKKWTDIVLKQQANAKWIAQNTKLCPWCNKAVERSQGCNFMACLCGKSFCYMCSKPWQPDHKDHFKCHIFKKRSDDELNKEKAVLAKLNFFAERYLNTNGLVLVLKKFDVFQKRKVLYQSLKVDLTDSQFIEQAYKFAIECCESLKWIYVYSYFVQIIDKNRKQRFDFTQGQYQQYKEQLLNKLGLDLKKLFDELDKALQINHQKLPAQAFNKFNTRFLNLKTNIINYYKSTKQFKQAFIKQIETLDASAIKRGDDIIAEQPSEKQDQKKKKK